MFLRSLLLALLVVLRSSECHRVCAPPVDQGDVIGIEPRSKPDTAVVPSSRKTLASSNSKTGTAFATVNVSHPLSLVSKTTRLKVATVSSSSVLSIRSRGGQRSRSNVASQELETSSSHTGETSNSKAVVASKARGNTRARQKVEEEASANAKIVMKTNAEVDEKRVGEIKGVAEQSKLKEDTKWIALVGLIGFVVLGFCGFAKFCESQGYTQQTAADSRRSSSCSAARCVVRKPSDMLQQRGVVLESKERAFYSCKLHILSDASFDKPYELNSWSERDVWISPKGVMYSYNDQDAHVESLFGGMNVGRLGVEQLPESQQKYAFCISMAFPATETPGQDPNPTYFAADDKETILCMLKTHGHFKQLLHTMETSPFVGILYKLRADAHELPHDRSNWEEHNVWIGDDGCLHCYKNECVMKFYEAIPVAHLELRILQDTSACFPFSVSLALNPEYAVDSDGAPLEKGKYADPIIVGADDEETVQDLVSAWGAARAEL